MHDHAQPGGEARRFGGPVAHDRRRCDHERGPALGFDQEVGEHGRRLAQAHVERQAAADAGGVEEAEPGERLGLVAAQLAVEALGRVRGFARQLARGGQEVGGPPSAFDADAAGQR